MEGADICGAVAEIGDGYLLLAVELGCPAKTVRDRHGRSDDAGRYHAAASGMGKMHRPPLALAASRDTPSQLGPQGFERESLGEHVGGAAVDGADIVVVAQVNRKRRSKERRGVKECVSRGRYRWSPNH